VDTVVPGFGIGMSVGEGTLIADIHDCAEERAAEASMYPKIYLDLDNICFSNPGKINFTT
jgi:hypothetical protein